MEELKIKINNEEYFVKIEETEEGKILVHCGKDIYIVDTEQDSAQALFNRQRKKEMEGQGQGVVSAPLPGIIMDVKVKVGDSVEEGQALVKLIAMKMENEVTAPKNGVVKEVKVKKNDNVSKDDILIVLE